MDFSAIEKRLNYNFKDKNKLKRALTLPSADGAENNQTLEFFGDAILEFIVSEKIYDENATEGELTERRKALVADGALTPVSTGLGLDAFLIKSTGDTNNRKAVPSAYEAVVAAIYLDGGMDEAKKFVLSTLDFSARTAANYKGDLQEYLQGRGEELPKYNSVDEGTPQKPEFIISVEYGGKTFTGRAPSKKQAEQDAAKRVLQFLKLI